MAKASSLSYNKIEYSYGSYRNAMAQMLLLTCFRWVTLPYNKNWDWKAIYHREKVDRPCFTFLKHFFKKIPVMKYMSHMHYRKQLDKNPNALTISTTHNWLWSNRSTSACLGRAHTHLHWLFDLASHVYLPVKYILLCVHISLLRVTKWH